LVRYIIKFGQRFRHSFFLKHRSLYDALDKIIDPEITNDSFHSNLMKYAGNNQIKTILEIGSSSGGGSTEAFVKAIRQRDDKSLVSLYCIELSKPRFEQLRRTYLSDAFVKPYNLSSISSGEFPSESDVITFYQNIPTRLNNAKLKTVLSWYRSGIDYIHKSYNDRNGIEFIKIDQKIDQFDMVLIDGSEFTGEKELEFVIGAKVIALDDTETYKCYRALRRLNNDPEYQRIVYQPNIRNGYAIFTKKNFSI
jgi:hypothetical protein